MADVKFELSAKSGVVAALVAVVVIGVRFATLGEVDDAKLDAAITAELRDDLPRELIRVVEAGDAHGAAEALEEGVRIHSTSVSKPLFSFSSSSDAVVRVEYSLLDAPLQTEYWEFEHSMIAGWRYRRISNQASYYLNFI